MGSQMLITLAPAQFENESKGENFSAVRRLLIVREKFPPGVSVLNFHKTVFTSDFQTLLTIYGQTSLWVYKLSKYVVGLCCSELLLMLFY